MKITANILGGILVLFGTVWFLQGINVLPGSFMTGQVRWAVYGGIAVAAGSPCCWRPGGADVNESSHSIKLDAIYAVNAIW